MIFIPDDQPQSLDAHPEAERGAGWMSRCPDGNPQRVRRALGFRERNVCELELRVPLGGDDGGVCEVIVDERDDEIYVRVLVCRDEDREAREVSWEHTNCPVRVWLDRPLGARAVIDIDIDEELPLFIPADLNSRPGARSTFVRVRRRRSGRQLAREERRSIPGSHGIKHHTGLKDETPDLSEAFSSD